MTSPSQLTKLLEEDRTDGLNLKWQPIETAPKGSSVLVFDGMIKTIFEAVFVNDEWWSEAEERTLSPTHWMRIPDPPQSENDTLK